MSKEISLEHKVAHRLFLQLLNNVETFPESEFKNASALLQRMGSSIAILRKEVFCLWAFAFDLMLNNSALTAKSSLEPISNEFQSWCARFVTDNREFCDGPEEFLIRREQYGITVSNYLRSVSGNGDLSIPLQQVIFPALFENPGPDTTTNDIRLSDATALREMIDGFIKSFFELCRICLTDLREFQLLTT